VADLVDIRMRLLGSRQVVAESRAASAALKGVGVSSAASSAATAKSGRVSSAAAAGLGALGAAAKTGAAAGFAALGYAAFKSVTAFREAEKIGAETEARLKSTGATAWITADQVADLAETLSYKTRIDDEEIQAAENMLLSFTNLRNEVGKGNDVFNQASSAVLDLAAGTKTDLLSATKQLGKALNDPVKGLTALSRGGTQFSEVQTEMIEKMVEQGDLMGAQKVILRELRKQYKGSAKAGTDAFDGLSVAWENLLEQAGKYLVPVLTDVAEWLTKIFRQARNGKGPLGDVVSVFQDLAAAVQWIANGPVGSAVKLWFEVVTATVGFWADNLERVVKALKEAKELADSVIPGGPSLDSAGAIGNGVFGASPGTQSDVGATLPVIPKLLSAPKSSGGGGGKPSVPFNLILDGKVLASGVARAGERAVARA
jgi:hypothetical protein